MDDIDKLESLFDLWYATSGYSEGRRYANRRLAWRAFREGYALAIHGELPPLMERDLVDVLHECAEAVREQTFRTTWWSTMTQDNNTRCGDCAHWGRNEPESIHRRPCLREGRREVMVCTHADYSCPEWKAIQPLAPENRGVEFPKEYGRQS